jgi:hypothetical protein
LLAYAGGTGATPAVGAQTFVVSQAGDLIAASSIKAPYSIFGGGLVDVGIGHIRVKQTDDTVASGIVFNPTSALINGGIYHDDGTLGMVIRETGVNVAGFKSTAATINVPTTVDVAGGGKLFTVKATSGSLVLQLQSADTGNSAIWFGDAADLDQGQILYTDNSKYMAFFADNTEFMRGSKTAATIYVPLTMGPSASYGATQHKINGHLIGSVGTVPGNLNDTSGMSVGFREASFHARNDDVTSMLAGQYFASAGQTKYANTTKFPALLQMKAQATATDSAMILYTSPKGATAEDTVSTYTTIFNITHAGAVTLGPASFAGQHTLNGNLATAGGGTIEYTAPPTPTSIIGGVHSSLALRNTATTSAYWFLSSGLKANSAGQSVPSIANVSGSYLTANPTSTGAGIALNFATVDSNSHAAGATGLSTTSKFTIAQNGNATLRGYTALGNDPGSTTGKNPYLRIKKVVRAQYTGSSDSTLTVAHGIADRAYIKSVTCKMLSDSVLPFAIPGLVYDYSDADYRQILVSWDNSNIIFYKRSRDGSTASNFQNSTDLECYVFYEAS